ncbi:hypothetical protein KAJ27_14065, partial [bacterium]|nr:hypothetical protein [bacterium]
MQSDSLNTQILSMSHTKKEMLDSYNELVKQVIERENQSLKPEKVLEEKTEKLIKEKVANINLDAISSTIKTFEDSILNNLSSLTDKLKNEYTKYDDLKKAVELKKSEVKEVYDIEISAHSLAALIESEKTKKEIFEKDYMQRKIQLESEISEKKSSWEKEKKNYEEGMFVVKEKEKKEQKQHREIWEYDFKRHKQKEEDTFNDLQAVKVKELKELTEEKEKELS